MSQFLSEVFYLPDNATLFLAAVAVAAVSSHLAIFRVFEVDAYGAHMIVGIWLSHLALASVLWYGDMASSAVSAYLFSLALVIVYVATVFASILVYRVWFHPLGSFPGPFLARTTGMWQLGQIISSGFQWFRVTKELQQQYGDFVRTGPREITVFDARAPMAVNGPQSRCTKGPWYGPNVDLISFRDKQEHRARRKIWDKAFNLRALTDLAPVIDEKTSTMLSRIAEADEDRVAVTEWCFYYSYDLMSLLAFGTSLDCLLSPKNHWVAEQAHDAVKFIEMMTPIAWVIQILGYIPPLMGGLGKVERYGLEMVRERRKVKTPKSDLLAYLMHDSKGRPVSDLALQREARTIITAGSDTSSSIIALTFLYLAMYPEIQRKLRAETEAFFYPGGQAAGSENILSTKCTYLEAIIQEVLRLHPAVPSGLQRLTPPEGVKIGETFIPGNMLVFVSTYNLQRDPRYFVNPGEFIPERWTTEPELITDKSAYAPFSIGPQSCIGKNMAYMELRSVLSKTLHIYELSLVDGFSPREYFLGITQRFTTCLPRLELRFRRRQGGGSVVR